MTKLDDKKFDKMDKFLQTYTQPNKKDSGELNENYWYFKLLNI